MIYNFTSDGDHSKLTLNVGQTVHVLEEEDGGWYYGYVLGNSSNNGIFPKNYVHITECTIDKSGPSPIFIPRQPLIVHEITTVLREWGTHWKHLYMVS